MKASQRLIDAIKKFEGCVLTAYQDTAGVWTIGGGGGDVMGGVTKAWVNQNFVSIEFFGRLFETYDSATPTPTQVLPNDLESTITNIKAKFGFWTEQYLSDKIIKSKPKTQK